MDELSDLMDSLEYTLFITGIHKDKYKKQYKDNTDNPYNIALAYTMERAVHFLESKGESEFPVIAEARGKNEDRDLERVFYRILTNGTDDTVADHFKNLTCPLLFKSKQWNIAGIQLADLSAHPCARHMLNPSQNNRAYEIVKKRIYTNETMSGWKVFP